MQPNYPNPFNPSTNISFVLASDMSVRLEIYNVRGQKVKTLCNSELTKGKHTLEWNGKDDQDRQVASGIYFSRLNSPEGNFVHKMMLMK
jgi:flagellar hook assembly protein FlgD